MILIKGAGDIASGIASRLFRAGFEIAMTDLEIPTSIRRSVCFSEAIRKGRTTVENITAIHVINIDQINAVISRGSIPVFTDKNGFIIQELKPEAVIDARLAKTNIDTTIHDATVVIGAGPGFCAGKDCHAVIETQRGHYLGRVIYHGSAAANTGIPGNIGGYTEERILRSPSDGIFNKPLEIGSMIKAGDIVAFVDDTPIIARISGVLRGILPPDCKVTCGMKSGDIDPRGKREYCDFVSDKALAVSGGVLEAMLYFGILPKKNAHLLQ